MSQKKNETTALILSLLVTVALLGAGIWWFTRSLNGGNLLPGGGNPTASGDQNAPSNARFSAGDRVLFPENASPEKQAAVQAIADGNFSQAVTDLETALRTNRNDPESLIYLNNARIGDQNAYTIAVAVPAAAASGPALEILRGVAQAQNEVNAAGGINGMPLKVLIASDENNPQLAEKVANQLVKDRNVLGVIGHFGSDATLAAAPVYQQGGLTMVSPTSTTIGLSGLGNFIFRTVPSDRFTAAALAKYMVETLGKQSAAVYFNSESAYSQSLKDEFTTALYGDGGQVTGEFDLKGAGFDAAASVDQSIQQNTQVLVFAANTATLEQAMQVVAANRKRLQMLGGDSLYNIKTLELGNENAVNMVVAVPWDLLSNPNAPFVRDSRQLWGADVNWRTAMAYDAAKALITALQRDPSRAGIAGAMRSGGFSAQGATGVVRFLPSGDRNQATQLVIIKPGNRTNTGFGFYPAP